MKGGCMSKHVAIGSILTSALLLLLPASGFAHPEPGATAGLAQVGLAHVGLASGFAHPFTGLDHILAMVAVGLLAVNIGGRAVWALPLTFMALMASGGGLGLAGIALPYVEAIVGLSVLVLGLAVAIPRAWPVPAAMLVVGAFAIFHGHAHITDMAAAFSPLEYGLGFMLATGVLHLLGIGIGTGAWRLGPFEARHLSRWMGVAIAVSGLALFA
jgi:urease accessory protein